MKNGPPNKIRSMPPLSRSADQVLADLEKLQEWTEEPARDAADAIFPRMNPVTPPVEEKPAAQGVVPVTTRFPASVAAQIRYHAGSTYGVTINSFVVDAVREKLARET